MRYCFLLIILLVGMQGAVMGQQQITVNLATLDGVPLTPDNIFNFQLQSVGAGMVQVKGAIRYRGNNSYISYSFGYKLQDGPNVLRASDIHPQWQFSSPALRELFFDHRVLPEGTYEYCVTVVPGATLPEATGLSFDDCLYHRADGTFLINLIEPADKSKLDTKEPLLVWVANYTFSSSLEYRLRIAEIKQGQNTVNAVMRNKPLYDGKGLLPNSMVYPPTAKPLETNVPYAWTVEAYYKGVLLGGSEAWQFIIPEDTVGEAKKVTRSYIDITREKGINRLYAIGTLRLKFQLKESIKEVLELELYDDQNEKVNWNTQKLSANYGDNRYDLDLLASGTLKHGKHYLLKISTSTGRQFVVAFEYENPNFIK